MVHQTCGPTVGESIPTNGPSNVEVINAHTIHVTKLIADTTADIRTEHGSFPLSAVNPYS